MRILAAAILVTVCAHTTLPAQQIETDTTRADTTTADSITADTSTTDTTRADSLPDFMRIDPETGDTVIVGEAERFRMQDRLKEFQDSQIKRPPRLNFHDSLLTYFAPQRLNQRDAVSRSIFKNAGDFFKFDPSYFALDYQTTPMRTIITPFGLSGDRLNVISFGESRRPFEHVIEPDGQVDMHDIPIAQSTDLYVLPGAAGQLFGGPTSVATLVTAPRKVEAGPARSAFIVDQGSFAFNHLRGRFAKQFQNHREIDLAIGYRNAEGSAFGRDDDTRHYLGRIFEPMGESFGFNADIWLYDRSGPFSVRPNLGGRVVNRDRFERSAHLSADWHADDGSERWELGYNWQRQGSKITGIYAANLDYFVDGLFASHQRRLGGYLVSFDAAADKVEFDAASSRHQRARLKGDIRLIKTSHGSRFGLTIGSNWEEDYRFLPRASITWLNESDRAFLYTSIGYSERAPSLYELYLPFQRKTIYNTTTDYADSGNETLKSERQLTGSLLFHYGSPDTWAGVQVTGGQIIDGIDWRNEFFSDSISYRYFYPDNGDITFAGVTVQQQLQLFNFLWLRSGGSYHWTDYEQFDDKAYIPEYQAFIGGEINLYWPQRLLHFFAYGEIVYTGEYDGFVVDNLAGDFITNTRLAARLKDFTFHVVFENNLNALYSEREGFTFLGQYFYYGFVWNFLN